MIRDRPTSQARPALPGALWRGTAVFALLLIAACTSPGPVDTVQPAQPSTPPTTLGGAEPSPAMQNPAVTVPVDGERQRVASWQLVSAEGTDLIVAVQAGGAPCDAVTGADVTEDARSVSLKIWAGPTPGATCTGQPALLGTTWIRVPLDAPLGGRTLHTA